MSAIDRIKVSVVQDEFSVLVAGPEKGTQVVFLHGMPASASLWKRTMGIMARCGYRVYAPDLPGYGQTTLGDSSDYSIEATGERLAYWIRQLSTNGVWVVAHDLGGAIAQVLAANYPKLFSHLSLCNTVYRDSWPIPEVKLFRGLARSGVYSPLAAMKVIPRIYAQRNLERGLRYPKNLSKSEYEEIFWNEKVSTSAGRRAFSRLLSDLDSSATVEAADKFADVEIPVQIVWGKRDKFQPWYNIGAELSAAFDGPTVSHIEDAGHFVMLDQPALLASTLIDFYEQNQPEQITETYRPSWSLQQ